MGLLEPTNGQILIDEEELTDKNIGSLRSQEYPMCPNQFFYSMDQFIENIAFGLEKMK